MNSHDALRLGKKLVFVWLKRLAVLLALVLPLVSQSATWHVDYIKFVYPQANGSFILIFVTDPPACTAAAPGKYLVATVGINGVTLDGLKLLYSAALAAQLAGRQVQVNFNEASSTCDINRIIVMDQ